MNIPATVFAAVERFDIPEIGSRIFSGRVGEAHAIVLVGAIAAVIGLACVAYGLRSEWQQWTKTHMYRRREHD